MTRHHILGAPVDDVDYGHLRLLCSQTIAQDKRLCISYVNIHVVNHGVSDSTLIDNLRAMDLVYCDGFGIKLGLLIKGVKSIPRNTAVDFIDDLFSRALRYHWRIGLIGGTPATMTRACDFLTRRFNGISIRYFPGDYHRDASTTAFITLLKKSEIDLLFVAFGTPRQEAWTTTWRDELSIPVIWNIGGLFDYFGGSERTPPRFLASMGLEWSIRLLFNPAKHWRRYLIGNPLFFIRILLDSQSLSHKSRNR